MNGNTKNEPLEILEELELETENELINGLRDLIRNHFTPNEIFGWDAIQDFVAQNYNPDGVFPHVCEWVAEHYGENYVIPDGLILEVRVAELESLTEGIDWKEWHDSAEILASQEGWKRTAERYWEVLDRMRRDGCGNASPIHPGSSEFETCREILPGEPDEWCWSCQAHAALNT